MQEFTRLAALGATLAMLSLGGCSTREERPADAAKDGAAQADDDAGHDHAHDGDAGHDHADGDAGHDHADGDADHDHAHAGGDDHHDEVAIGSTMIGDLEVACWQGHGSVAPGKELHLVVKLPYNDAGASLVRAWIGGADRLASIVGKGAYAPSHDDYDIHAEAPDPLPAGAAWWIEVEKPDGTKQVGSIALR